MRGKILVLLVAMALLVGVLSGCIEEEKEEANKAPEADFSFTPSSPTSGENVQFTDKSSDPDGADKIKNWSWDFTTDGTADSYEQNPTYSYATAGSYDVTLTVTDDKGDTGSKKQTIKVNVEPVANFTWSYNVTTDYNATTQNATVTFTDNSTDSDGSIASYLWDFGDENTSILEDPIHIYANVIATTTYTVTLTVTDDSGATNSKSQTVTVTVP